MPLPPSLPSLPQVNDIAPAWHEEITFDNVLYPPSSKICITIVYRSGKKDEVLGVACPGSNLWTTGETPPQVGLLKGGGMDGGRDGRALITQTGSLLLKCRSYTVRPGWREGKRSETCSMRNPISCLTHLVCIFTHTPQDRWLPVATKEGIYAGELNFHVHWTKTQVRYRQSVELLQVRPFLAATFFLVSSPSIASTCPHMPSSSPPSLPSSPSLPAPTARCPQNPGTYVSLRAQH